MELEHEQVILIDQELAHTGFQVKILAKLWCFRRQFIER
jgi:hypothetical protein